MKSILLIGQSNMAGRGFLADVPPIYSDSVHMLRNGRWQMMAEPIHFDREVAGVGPAASFAQQWVNDHPEEEIGLIPCAEGGSTIDEWAPEGILMRHALSEARFAMESSELIGILWHQGESDSYGGKYRVYREKLTAVFAHLRAELQIPDLPIVMGELGDYLGKSGFGASSIEFAEINQEMKKYVEEDEHTYLVTAKGLTANPDGIHIAAASQRLFGLRYYEAFTKKVDVKESLPMENGWIEQASTRPLSVKEQTYLLSLRFAKGELTFEEFGQLFAELSK